MQNNTQKTSPDATEQVVMFHDGDCPLCKFEVQAMQKLDTAKAIRWVDITKDKAALDKAGITYQQAMDRIHVQNEEQQLVTGVRGFITVWKHLPYYRRLVPVITRIPFLLPTMEFFYTQFAKHRLLLTGKKGFFTKRNNANKPEAGIINRINPRKLLLSKWTAVNPQNKERHFIVTELFEDEEKQIIACSLEAVINKRSYKLDWTELKNDAKWLMGWK